MPARQLLFLLRDSVFGLVAIEQRIIYNKDIWGDWYRNTDRHLYRIYVDKLICAVQEKTISNSDGAVLGLIRGISSYDEICADKILWNLVTDADNYYSDECKMF